MTRRACRSILVTVAVTGLAAIFIPEMRAAWTIRHKYRIGATADSIEREYGTRLPLVQSGVVLPNPTQDAKRHALGYSLYAPIDCVYVHFNFFREVTSVKKVTPFGLLQLWWTHGQYGS